MKKTDAMKIEQNACRKDRAQHYGRLVGRTKPSKKIYKRDKNVRYE